MRPMLPILQQQGLSKPNMAAAPDAGWMVSPVVSPLCCHPIDSCRLVVALRFSLLSCRLVFPCSFHMFFVLYGVFFFLVLTTIYLLTISPPSFLLRMVWCAGLAYLVLLFLGRRVLNAAVHTQKQHCTKN